MNTDTSALVFVGLVALLVVNRLVLTLVGYDRMRPLFWTVQIINLLAACALIIFGLPGLPPGMGIISYFIALLFILHIVENNSHRMKAIRAAMEGERDPLERRRQAIRQRLRDSSRATPGEETDHR